MKNAQTEKCAKGKLNVQTYSRVFFTYLTRECLKISKNLPYRFFCYKTTAFTHAMYFSGFSDTGFGEMGLNLANTVTLTNTNDLNVMLLVG